MIKIKTKFGIKEFDSKRKAAYYYYENDGIQCIKCNNTFYLGPRILHQKYSDELDYSDVTLCPKCNIIEFDKSEYAKACRSNQLKNQWLDDKFRESQLNRLSQQMSELWNDPESANKVSTRMSNNHKDINFLISMYESRGWNLNNPGVVYLVKYSDCIKVGFSQNINDRLTWLGRPELIGYKEFSIGYDALTYEQNFHNKHKSEMIDSEYYPLSCLTQFKSELNI